MAGVPRELFGLPIGDAQSDDPSRIAELVQHILEDKPQALLLSARGHARSSQILGCRL
jgi:hypothetical protein